ncbi:MAG: MerR family DNA-binding transcriptional regulator [Chloroflexi bacterium]|nr:MerR family DNA-binding transcriptional regulator [Chloroflexota bacterium]
MKVSIGRAAKELGVTRETLRRWEAAGRIEVERAPNGRRRYDLEKLRSLVPVGNKSKGISLAYARISSAVNEWELVRQVSLLESFCSVNGWVFQVCYDKGNGVGDSLGGLKEVLRRIQDGEIGRLVVTHLNRIPKAAAEIVFSMCERFGTEVVIVNATENMVPDEGDDLDAASLISEFASGWNGEKMWGRVARSRKDRAASTLIEA